MLLVVQQWDWHVQQRRLHHLAVNHHKTRLLKAGKCSGSALLHGAAHHATPYAFQMPSAHCRAAAQLCCCLTVLTLLSMCWQGGAPCSNKCSSSVI